MQKQHLGLCLAFSLAVFASCATQGGQGAPAAVPAERSWAADSAEAHVAAERFLAAFDSLQFDAFRSYFADDITMFFPFPQFAARVRGKQEVEEVFGSFMNAAREGRINAGRPPVLGITARDLVVQMATRDVAVVSFHLGAEETPARRSVVFRKSPTGWEVIHWHASALAPAPDR